MLPAIILFAATYVLMLTFSKYRPYIALASGVIFIVSGMLPLGNVLGALDFNVLLMIAGIEGGLNAVIGALNTLHWEIPSWVPGLGGKGFGFDIPKANFGRIPELASGAVINPNSPFLAILGDQKSGTNIEAPLETIKQALVEAMGTAGGQQIVIPVYIGQDRIDTVIAKANTNYNFISGGR